MADNAIQGWLHRPGRNLERLQKIGPDPDRDDHRNQNYFNVFTPRRILRRWHVLQMEGVQLFGRGFHRSFVPGA